MTAAAALFYFAVIGAWVLLVCAMAWIVERWSS